MPHPNRRLEILQAIRKHLKVARKGQQAITDESLMKVAKCSRTAFYRYVTKGSEIEQEIEYARTEQSKNPGVPVDGPRRRDGNRDSSGLRMELEQAKEGNRELLGKFAQLVDNLKLRGVKDDVIQWAINTPMTKPVRSVSHAGHSRRKKR